MSMSDFISENRTDLQSGTIPERSEPFVCGEDEDFVGPGLLENINSTPIGRLLKIIGSLPEIRTEKVFNARQQINDGEYDANRDLDEALDRMLEELITEG